MINFYTTKGPFGSFTNYSRHQIIIDGKIYPTVENFYQSMKFVTTDPEYAEQIRNATKPGDAQVLGNVRRNPPIRGDWEEIKDEIMYKGVLKKFETHTGIRKTLLNTGDEEICEASPIDSYWGCGPDGKGQNKLGKILQRVREDLRKKYGE